MKNESLIKEKNIENNYIELQNKYKKLFEQYILQKINLKKYDDLILNSNLDFGISIPNTQQLFTELENFLELKYIYIINNFFIEKLDNNALELLIKSPYNLNEQTYSLIEGTYKDIIKDNFNNEYSDKKYYVCYGYNIKSNYAYNDALVFHIIYSRNTKEYSDEEFIQNIKDKRIFLDTLKAHMIEEINQQLSIPCHVIVSKCPN